MEICDTKNIRNQIIENDHVINTCKSFLDVNKNDEDAKTLILTITCEILDCSIDTLLEAIN